MSKQRIIEPINASVEGVIKAMKKDKLSNENSISPQIIQELIGSNSVLYLPTKLPAYLTTKVKDKSITHEKKEELLTVLQPKGIDNKNKNKK